MGTYTAAAFADLMARRLEVIAARIGNNRAVRVKGVLHAIPSAYRGVIYDVPLVDPDSPTDVVLLQVRPSTLRGVQEGDTVIACGSIVTNFYKGQLKLRLQVDRLEIAEPLEDRERRLVELPILETVRRAGGVRRSFPHVPSPTVALLRSETAAVREDFLKALGSLRQELRIREVDVAMANPEDVAAAIRGVREEVMVLIRGGGDDADFMVFETPQVIRALGACHAFRVLGLGHTKHRTLADCIADYAANVPADAGRFLSRRVLEARLLSKQTGVVAPRRRSLIVPLILMVLVTAAILLSLLLLPFR